jgi:sugar phosphate isomerase/epimerase
MSGLLKLGFDNYAIRSLGWKARQLLDHAAQQRCDALLFSDLDVFEDRSDAALHELRARAVDQGIELYAGTLSICPTSCIFKPEQGTAEEQLRETIRVARALGSPIARCVLGNWKDRLSPGGIAARIDDTVKVLRAVRSFALDAGVKIAIENHAGDLQARELIQLIEAAGREFVGATMDSGNAPWALDDPLLNLERLGPLALCTGIRDTAIWLTDDGAMFEWVALGEGNVDWPRYFARYAELCPNTPVFLETISARQFAVNFLQDDFWNAFEDVRPREFARFLQFARRGTPRAPVPADRALDGAFQREQLERSLRHGREVLGLGRRG